VPPAPPPNGGTTGPGTAGAGIDGAGTPSGAVGTFEVGTAVLAVAPASTFAVEVTRWLDDASDTSPVGAAAAGIVSVRPRTRVGGTCSATTGAGAVVVGVSVAAVVLEPTDWDTHDARPLDRAIEVVTGATAEATGATAGATGATSAVTGAMACVTAVVTGAVTVAMAATT
jgi:hypothetical protein